MRIADKMALQQVQSSLGRNRLEMHNLQEQSSTQRRINKPSDDPLGATRVLGAKSDERNQRQFLKSIDIARDFLSFTDQSLSEVTDILSRAKEVALNQASEASANIGTRQVAAREVEQLLKQTLQLANGKAGDRYIFGGFRTNQAPFSKDGTYHGDNGEIKIQVNKDAYSTMNIPGDRIFLGESASEGTVDATDVPRGADALKKFKEAQLIEEERINQQVPLAEVHRSDKITRGIATVGGPDDGQEGAEYKKTAGANIFEVLNHLVISLQTDNKKGIQDSLEEIDLAFNQVISGRAQVGARVATLNSTQESLQKEVVESRTRASLTEDADVFQLVNDIHRAESALKASLETSGRLIQPSLLDFLK
ncbi:MAG: flagellar hook-associated protein 3 [Pseudomonadota bacterium]|jgi:flagellar hook-associated protein 3 FlgL